MRRLMADEGTGSAPADDGAKPFEVVTPAPQMLYGANGQQHDGRKSEFVDAISDVIEEMRCIMPIDAVGKLLKEAGIILIDLTAKIYAYREDVKNLDEFAAATLNAAVARGRSGAHMFVLVMDSGSNPYKAFEAALRRGGVPLQPFGGAVTAETPMPSASDWPAFICRKATQAVVWQLIIKAARAWQASSSARVTVILDGPAAPVSKATSATAVLSEDRPEMETDVAPSTGVGVPLVGLAPRDASTDELRQLARFLEAVYVDRSPAH